MARAKRRRQPDEPDESVTDTGVGAGVDNGAATGEEDESGSNVRPTAGESQTERLRRRAAFLRDLAEAKELRERVSPRRTRVARLRQALRRATYRS